MVFWHMSLSPEKSIIGGEKGSDELFSGALGVARFPAGGGLELVYSPVTRAKQLLSASAVQMLQSCSSLEAIADHAQRLHRDGKFGTQQTVESITKQLEELASCGLLISKSTMLEKCLATVSKEKSNSRIESLSIPTRNRPAELDRSLRSYVENSRENGREIQFCVSDQSDDLQLKDANLSVLEQIRKDFDVSISYGNDEEKRAFAKELASNSGVSPHVVDFALFNPMQIPCAIGANRNALLLQSVGELTAQVDDDTLCRLVPSASARNELTLSSQTDPTEFWFLDQPAADACHSESHSVDFFALHEQLLGKSVGDCIQHYIESSDSSAVDLTDVSATLFRRLETDNNRVIFTSIGVKGDSGMSSPYFLMQLGGEAHMRLTQSEEIYRQSLANRLVRRSVSNASISDGPFCMGLNLGLDNRHLLPPFIPVLRNEDGVFAVLSQTIQAGFAGHLPWLLSHKASTPGVFPLEELHQRFGRFGSGDILEMFINSVAPSPMRADAGENLIAVGEALQNWGHAPASDFDEMLRLLIGFKISDMGTALQLLLAQKADAPAFWKRDIEGCLKNLPLLVADPEFIVPWDLRNLAHPVGTRRLFQLFVVRLGELFQAWPAMYSAASDLRNKGIRLCRPIT